MLSLMFVPCLPGGLTMKKTLVIIIFAVAVFLPGYAHALPKIFSGSAGVLITAGANVWTEPESDYHLGSVPFGDTAGGYGVGGGVFFEARFIKYLGLEIDILFEHNDMWYSIDYRHGAAELQYHIKYVNYRLPILVKAVIPAGIMRFSIGIGPEFVFSRHSRTDIKETKGTVLNLDEVKSTFRSKGQNDVFICTALGFAFKVWKFSIPLNLRFSYNVTQPKDSDDRMNPVIVGNTLTLVASETMDISLMLGFAYDF